MATLYSPRLAASGASDAAWKAWISLPVLGWLALLALGGMGAAMPLAEAGLAVLAALVIAGQVLRRGAALAGTDRAALVLGAMLLALPLAQLVPLPPALWQGLAGREREAAILAELGQGARWMPLSLDPEATRQAMLGLLPALAMFFVCAGAGRDERALLVRLAVAAGLASALLGALQLASGGAFTPVDTVHRGHALGLFSNRNHQADFLLVAMLLLGALVPAGRARGQAGNGDRWIASALIALFAVAVLATSSRSGAALALLVVPASLALVWDRWIGWKRAGAALVGGTLALAALMQTGAGQALLARFSSPDDDRLAFWQTVIEGLPAISLWGGGMGSFAAIYRSIEPLDQMTGQFVNHAHSDYLELLVEGGIPALLLFAGWLSWIGLRGRAALRPDRPRGDRRLACAALGGLAVLGVHSAVDYPGRMLALAALAGLLAGLLLPASTIPARPGRQGLRWLLAGLLFVPVAVQAAIGGAARHARITDDAALAERAAPFSAQAASLAARFRLEQGKTGADALARSALRRSPLDVQALSTLALARDDAGEGEPAERLMDLAAQGGWWDFGTQLWMFDRARALGLPEVAMQRADALLRRGAVGEEFYPLLAEDLADGETRLALVARLETRPTWRAPFLAWLDRSPAAPEAVDALWQALRRSAAAPDLRERARHADALVRQGRFAQARAEWLGGRNGPVVADGDFTAVFRPRDERPDVPFEWQLDPAGSDVAVPLEDGAGGLQVNARPGFDGLVMRQLVVLPQGPGRLSFARLTPSVDAAAGIGWTLRCAGGAKLDLAVESPPAGSGWRRQELAFAVPPGCPAQWLELRGNGTSLVAVDSSFRGVEIGMDNAR